MGQVGRVRSHEGVDSCEVVLDSGETLLVSHQARGWTEGPGDVVTVQVVRLWGLARSPST